MLRHRRSGRVLRLRSGRPARDGPPALRRRRPGREGSGRRRARAMAPASTADERDELPASALHGRARLREPDRRRGAPRGRERARPRFGRGHRRAALRPPRRAHRHGLRAGHDRRDARPRARQSGRGRRGERALAQGPHRSHPTPGGDDRRGPLELRDQPLHRQAAGPARGGARAQAGRAPRRRGRRRRPRHGPRRPAATSPQYVGCIAGALTRDEYIGHLADAGLSEIEITETHRVHEHAASAIIRARKPA